MRKRREAETRTDRGGEMTDADTVTGLKKSENKDVAETEMQPERE